MAVAAILKSLDLPTSLIAKCTMFFSAGGAVWASGLDHSPLCVKLAGGGRRQGTVEACNTGSVFVFPVRVNTRIMLKKTHTKKHPHTCSCSYCCARCPHDTSDLQRNTNSELNIHEHWLRSTCTTLSTSTQLATQTQRKWTLKGPEPFLRLVASGNCFYMCFTAIKAATRGKHVRWSAGKFARQIIPATLAAKSWVLRVKMLNVGCKNCAKTREKFEKRQFTKCVK